MAAHPAFIRTMAVVVGSAICICLATGTQAQTVRLKWVEAGADGRMSPVRPRIIDLNGTKPSNVKRMPPDVTHPLFGALTIGPAESPARVNVLLDAPPDKPTRLFMDVNGNGDFTDDPKPQWEAKTYTGGGGKSFTQFTGGVTVSVQYGKTTLPLHLTLQRFDPSDPIRAGYNGAILYSPDYAREGDLTLGAKTYRVMLLDALIGGDFRGLAGGGATGIFLLIDVNGNGVFDARGEIYDSAQPFNIGGVTYALKDRTASGETLELVKSPTQVAEIPPPPDLRIGRVVPGFAKKAMDGSTLHFPSDYHGKLVLLSFWASDCGVCASELPEMVKAYNLFHEQGLEIVGVSLDHENAVDRITEFTKRVGMVWPEIYDGKWVNGEVAQLYFVHITPTAILVDGDTGKVVAAGNDLRGDNLQKTLAVAITNRDRVARKP